MLSSIQEIIDLGAVMTEVLWITADRDKVPKRNHLQRPTQR